ncbi:16S rRNA (uracil(1498)-N(3))-methyltransferase [Rhodoferax sp.]|uniref:16S rRNA (uracil(1498)-N(3))-methyltransferase n=1 Tax=Rhodoferax sp. TaxID=50421 RepID=UPI0025E5A870|nr:16S rRNA (uracil(1498)-N(3))-methyltransferase [Rhodoferax sp.]
MPRFYCATPLLSDSELDLPAGAARHVQVLRLQPGDSITLFDGRSQDEFDATVTRMGRSDVQVRVGAARSAAREPARQVHLAVGMPANDRMDWLIEKATELGVASIQPLMTERSVLKLSGERAEKKVAHWQSVAIAACEQCGGNRVPEVRAMQTLSQWLKSPLAVEASSQRLLLSLRPGSTPVAQWAPPSGPAWFLSGPEGGLSHSEEELALQAGFSPASLGPRVLRAETAALAALTLLTQL